MKGAGCFRTKSCIGTIVFRKIAAISAPDRFWEARVNNLMPALATAIFSKEFLPIFASLVRTIQLDVGRGRPLYQLGLIMAQLVKAMNQIGYPGCQDAQSYKN
jgi:hypothetical protein